jgi:hypothetical protein
MGLVATVVGALPFAELPNVFDIGI